MAVLFWDAAKINQIVIPQIGLKLHLELFAASSISSHTYVPGIGSSGCSDALRTDLVHFRGR